MAFSSAFLKKLVPLMAALCALAVMLPLYGADLDLVKRMRNLVFDTYQRLDPREPFSDSITVILDIDEESLRQIGQWPWPRSYIARIVDYLQRAGVGVIAFDVLFSEPDRTSPHLVYENLPDDLRSRLAGADLPNNDSILADVLAQGGVVLGETLLPPGEGPSPVAVAEKFGVVSSEPHARGYLLQADNILEPLAPLRDLAAGVGTINPGHDPDGVIRSVPLFSVYTGPASPDEAAEQVQRVHASLSMEALSVYLHRLSTMMFPDRSPDSRTYRFKTVGGSGETGFGAHLGIVYADTGGLKETRYRILTDPTGALRVHYAPKETQQVISFVDLATGAVGPDAVAGKIVLIGSSAAGLRDLRFNSLGEEVPGVFVHAAVIDQIMAQHFLVRPDYAPGLERMSMIALAAALVAVIYRFGAIVSGLLGAAIVGTGLFGSFFAFQEHRLLFDPILPSISALAVFMSCSLARYWQTESDRKFVRNAFRTFVSPNLVDSLALHPEALKLGGTRKECTFIFTDLAGFTSFVEKSDPEVAVPLLNDYIDNMVQIGLKHGGYLDKIVGDATVFHFNAFLAPLDQPDHRQRAYDCAQEMDRWASAYSERKQAEGIPLNETRIGVNSGLVTMGNFGGAIMDYTAHGDAINTAARLESAGKFLGVKVSISGATLEGVEGFVGRPCGTLVLKGQTIGTPVFEPMTEERLNGAAVQQYMRAYDLMKAESPDALAAMEEVLRLDPEDGLAKMHLTRLRGGETGVRIVMTGK